MIGTGQMTCRRTDVYQRLQRQRRGGCAFDCHALVALAGSGGAKGCAERGGGAGGGGTLPARRAPALGRPSHRRMRLPKSIITSTHCTSASTPSARLEGVACRPPRVSLVEVAAL